MAHPALLARTHLLDARDINGRRHSSLIYGHTQETEVVDRGQGLNQLEPLFIRRQLREKYTSTAPENPSYNNTQAMIRQS